MTPEGFSYEPARNSSAPARVQPRRSDRRAPAFRRARLRHAARARSAKAGELGLLGVDIPEEYGGLGLDKSTSMLVAEAQARATARSAVTFGAHTGIGTLPIVYFGTPAQKQQYLPELATGEMIAAYALTEPGSGSDALGAKTHARVLSRGRQALHPERRSKQWITNAGFADVFIVFAKVDGEQVHRLHRRARHARASPSGAEEHKMGIRGSSTCPLILEDVRGAAENVLGEIGKGHKIAFNILNIGRFKLGAAAVGGAQDVAAQSRRRATRSERKPVRQADRRASGSSARSSRDMATRIYVGESMGYRTAGLIDAAPMRRRRDRTRRRASWQPSRSTPIEASHHEGVRLRDARLRRRRDAADPRRLRLHRGVPRRARLPRRAHQPHLRGHQRDQPPAHPRHALQARDEGRDAADGGGDAARRRAGERRQPESRRSSRASVAVPAGWPRSGALAEMAKRQFVFAAKWAATLGPALEERQEVLAALADCAIEVYAMDSVLGRTLEATDRADAARRALPLLLHGEPRARLRPRSHARSAPACRPDERRRSSSSSPGCTSRRQ